MDVRTLQIQECCSKMLMLWWANSRAEVGETRQTSIFLVLASCSLEVARQRSATDRRLPLHAT